MPPFLERGRTAGRPVSPLGNLVVASQSSERRQHLRRSMSISIGEPKSSTVLFW